MRHQLHEIFRALSAGDALRYLLARAIERASGQRWRLLSYRFYAQPLAAVPGCAGRGLSIHVAAPAPPLSAAQARRPQDVLDARARQRACCLAAWRKAELTGFLWYASDTYEEDEVRACYVLPPAAVWDFDVQVFTPHRLGLTFARLWEEASRRLTAQGKQWSLSRISSFNQASRRAQTRLGAHELGRASFLCGPRWQWMLATVPPYFHLSRCACARPRLRFTLAGVAA